MGERWGASQGHANQKPAISRAEIGRGIYGMWPDWGLSKAPWALEHQPILKMLGMG